MNTPSPWKRPPISEEEMRHIANAPELLDALHKVLIWIETTPDLNESRPEALEAVRAAIAREMSNARWEQWRLDNPDKAAASEERRAKRARKAGGKPNKGKEPVVRSVRVKGCKDADAVSARRCFVCGAWGLCAHCEEGLRSSFR